MRLTFLSWSLVMGTLVLGACANPSPTGARSDRTEQCYRNGPMRTCVPAARAGEAQRAVVHALAPPAPSVARLVVVRNSVNDFHRHAHLLLNGRPTQQLIPCASVGVDVKPGSHRLLVVPAASSAPLKLQLEAGSLTVVQVRRVAPATATQGPLGFELVPISRGQALRLVQECQILGLIDETEPAPASASAPM